MTKSEIDAVLDRVRTWPVERQEDAVRTLLLLEERGLEPYQLSPEDERAIDEGEASGVARDEDVQTFFSRYRG